jgi:hypothetical protein
MKKIRVSEKTTFLSEIQYKGLTSPGAGHYNPKVNII